MLGEVAGGDKARISLAEDRLRSPSYCWAPATRRSRRGRPTMVGSISAETTWCSLRSITPTSRRTRRPRSAGLRLMPEPFGRTHQHYRLYW